MSDRPLILVSHGYENIYERGFCNGLSDAGIRFTLVSSDRTDYAGLRPGTTTKNLRGSQDESRARWRKLVNLIRYHLSLMWYAARHRHAIVHLIGLIEPPLLCGVIEGLWFHLVSHRYVLTVHDIVPHDRGTRLNHLLFGWSFRIADRLVVHTPRVRDELMVRHGVDAERITVMEHGLEPLRGPLPSLATYRSGERFRLLFFGYVMRYKGLDLLLDALADFAYPFTLTIAGSCRDPALAAALQAQIETHPKRDSIHWINQYVHERDIESHFASSHALVLPYRRIDQSGVLFQALRFGLPVVATRVGALASYVTPEVGEVCEPVQSGEIRDALVRLVDRYEQLDRHAIVDIARRFEWQSTVASLRPVYG
jgi:glycosyltransferase involved in cell wall biosynthesis